MCHWFRGSCCGDGRRRYWEKGSAGCGVSYLLVGRERQPGFAMVRRDYAEEVSQAIEAGERKLAEIWMRLDERGGAGWLWVCDAERFASMPAPTELEMGFWFINVNTPQELAEAEAWARAGGVERA